MDPGGQTSATLLDRLRNTTDSDAWERFATFYQPVIYRYAKRCGCSDQMGWDIVQETLVDLLSIMPAFEYDQTRGRFRAFLHRVVRHRVLCAFRRESRYVNEADGASTEGLLVNDETGADIVAARWEEEWQRQLLSAALKKLQQHTQPRTFQAFRAYVLEGRPVDDVCTEFALEPNALYQIRHRLVERLKQVVEGLESDLESSSG